MVASLCKCATLLPCAIVVELIMVVPFFQIRDRQISLSLGKPMIISSHDCDIEPVTESDFPEEPREIGRYVVAQARLSVTGMYTS